MKTKKMIDTMRAIATGPFGSESLAVRAQARGVSDIEDWVLEHIEHSPDPVSEMPMRPDWMIATLFEQGRCVGDVDDIAVLVAAMGLSIGLDAEFVTVCFDGRKHPWLVFTRLKRPEEEWPENPIAGKHFERAATGWSIWPVRREDEP